MGEVGDFFELRFLEYSRVYPNFSLNLSFSRFWVRNSNVWVSQGYELVIECHSDDSADDPDSKSQN